MTQLIGKMSDEELATEWARLAAIPMTDLSDADRDRLVSIDQEGFRRKYTPGRWIWGPAKFDDFDTGDFVAHISMGDGQVTEKTPYLVTVTYVGPRRNDGTMPKGVYDRRWFELNPTFLFHRHTTA